MVQIIVELNFHVFVLNWVINNCWTKCGHVCFLCPFAMDVTVAIHVEINRGPNNVTLHCQGPVQGQRSVSQVSGTSEHHQQKGLEN